MIVKETLSNGLILITETMEHVRSVAVGVWLRRGSRHEPIDQTGISHFIEHMVFKGTKNRSAETIAAEVDRIGGHMDAFTSKEYAAFHLKVLDEHLPLAVDILGDVVLNPLFDPEDVAKEKKVIFEEINLVEDTPDDLVVELFTEAFWPDHPLGRPILGNKRSVARFTDHGLAAFFRAAYCPANLIVAAAGHVEHDALKRLLEHHFGALVPRRVVRDGHHPPRPTSRIMTRSKRELEQVHFCLGGPALSQTHADRYSSYILNAILGGSMSSRLFQNIREKRALVYSISSGVTSYSDAGHLTVYAGTGLETLEQVVRLTLDEFRRLKDETVSADELRRAKDHLKGSLLLSLENTGSRMSYLARQEIYFGRQISMDETLAGIESAEAEDVRRLAGTLLGHELALSVLGNLQGYRPRRSLLRI